MKDFYPSSRFNRNTLSAAAAIPIALIALNKCGGTTSEIDELKQHAYAICEGGQSFVAESGQSLSGLIEAHVETEPEDKLKSGKGLHDIASALTRQSEYDGHDDEHLYIVNTSMMLDPMQLQKGKTYTIPTSCERVE